MKTHTQNYKDRLIYLGKEINAQVIYTIDNVEHIIEGEDLTNVTPHYKGAILKSVMKQLDVRSSQEIPTDTIVNFKFGLKIGNSYEYVDYGNYIVKEVERQEDTNTYLHKCYDKMLYAMKDYEELEIEYPITIRDYLSALCNKLEIDFANANDDFTNYNQQVKEDLFKDLGYTYRDILDQLAQVTASTICINKDDQLEIRYINDSINESEEVEGQEFEITDNDADVVKIQELEGKIEQETTLGTNYFNALNFNNNSIVVSNEGQTITMPIVSSGNGITSVGRTLAQLCPNLKVGDVVYLKAKPHFINETTTPYNTFIYLSKSARLWDYNYANGYTITQDDLDSNVSLYANRYNTGETKQVVIDDFRIVKTYSDEWEKFTYGASPNPNYPQDINIKTGRQEIEIVGQNKVDLTPLTEDKFRSTLGANVSEWVYDEELKRNVYHIGRIATSSGTYPQTTFYLPMERFNPTGKNWAIVYRYKFTTNNPGQWGAGAWIGFSGRNNWETVGINSSTYAKDIRILQNADNWQIGSMRISKDNNEYTKYPTSSYKYMSICLSSGNSTICDLYVSDIMVVEITDEEYNADTYTPPSFEEYKIQNYEINLGKNLFDINQTINNMSATLTRIENGIRVTLPVQNGTYKYGFIKIPNSNELLGKTLTLTATIEKSVNSLVPTIAVYGITNTSVSGRQGFIENQVGTRSVTFTLPKQYPANVVEWGILFYANLTGTGNVGDYVDYTDIQLELGTKSTSISEYFEPIELGRIKDTNNTIYKDEIKQTKGYNLFNQDYYSEPSLYTINVYKYVQLDLKADKRYYVQTRLKKGKSPISGFYLCLCNKYQPNLPNNRTAWFVSNGSIVLLGSQDFAGGESEDLFFSWYPSSVTPQQVFDTYEFMISTNNVDFEPYAPKGTWFIEKNIGKVIFDGVDETWTQSTSTTNNKYAYWLFRTQIYNYGTKSAQKYSNYFTYNKIGWKTAETPQLVENGDGTNLDMMIFSGFSDITTTNDWKTWLSTHITIVYYIYQVPTITKITNDNYPELLSQLKALEKMKLLDGYTKITSSFPIKFSYATDYETINEDYIKNTRASFGEKYGPINSIVLSRSADSDNIYLRDEESIDENGLTELKIKDNQFMNDNDRDNYLPGILSRLNGLQFYPTDFESIGITYLDLCDKYRCKVRGNYYDCVMLNNEVEVSSGLNEIIYAGEPKQTETDYKKADTTDRRINQAYIIVDKQNQEIESLTSKTSQLESKQINDKNELLDKFGDYALQGDVAELTTQVSTLQTDTYTKTEVKSILKGTFTDSSGQVVPELVKTTSATFDENGMLYEKTNAKTNTRINEVGMKVNNSTNNTELMFAGYDDNTNQTIVRSENMTVRKYFVVGTYSRLEDYKTGTGVFDI